MWNKKANTCGYCPATINNEEDGSYRSCEDIMTDWGWTCQEVIDMVGESFCSQCPSCDITADDGDGGDACSGLARKKCKNTAGCAYKKNTCSASDACSGLAKKKCKKKDSGCQWKDKACQTNCKKQKKKGKCKKAGCKWKAKKEKCVASKK